MQKKEKLSRLKQLFKRESKAIFLGLSAFSGAVTFCLLIPDKWVQDMPNKWWWLLPISGALIVLPQLFTRLQGVNEPYLVLFARAFRSGFLLLNSLLPILVKLGLKLSTLWGKTDEVLK